MKSFNEVDIIDLFYNRIPNLIEKTPLTSSLFFYFHSDDSDNVLKGIETEIFNRYDS